jgi:hypothetical protein
MLLVVFWRAWTQLHAMLLEVLVKDMEHRSDNAGSGVAGVATAGGAAKRLKPTGDFMRMLEGNSFGFLAGSAGTGPAAAAATTGGELRAAAERELKAYIAADGLAFHSDAVIDGEKVSVLEDPLKEWAKKASEYPNVARLARRYLCVPATTAPSERIFSSAGSTITKKRNSLDAENARSLVFLHNAWPALDAMAAQTQLQSNCAKAVAKVVASSATQGKGKGKKRKTV